MIKSPGSLKNIIFPYLILGATALGLTSCNAPNASIAFLQIGPGSINGSCSFINYYDAGSGTPGDPYQIFCPAQIQSLATQQSAWSAGIYFNLMNDIDMQNGTLNGPIGNNPGTSFSGTFDGQGNTIGNVIVGVSADSVAIGFFGQLGSSATIKNLLFNNLQITGGVNGREVGAIGNNSGLITNVHVLNSNISLSNSAVLTSIGALVGLNTATGIISQSGVDQTQISALGSANDSQAGGLVGENGGTVTSSYVGPVVTISSSNTNITQGVGGLIGNQTLVSAQVTNVYAAGIVTGSINVGGLIGYMTGGTVAYAYASGSISGTSSTSYTTGGLIGSMIGGSLANAFAAENSITTPHIAYDGADYVIGEQSGASISATTVSYVGSISCPGSCTDNISLSSYPAYEYYSPTSMFDYLSWSFATPPWNYTANSYPTFSQSSI